MNAWLRKTLTDLLMDLLKAYSPTGREEAAARVFEAYTRELGFEVHRDDVGSVYAYYGSGTHSIALVGHIDTVPGFVEVKLDGSTITGRGAVDAKGPLAAALIGAYMAKGLLREQVNIYVVALVGEEGDSRGALNMIKSGIRFDGFLILEPSNMSIVVGYRGSLKVRVICGGSAGHSASPPSTPTACDNAIKAWLNVRGVFGDFSASGTSASLTYMRCGDGAATVHPGSAEMLLDVRYPHGVELNDVIAELRSSIGSDCSLEVLEQTPPVRVDINNLAVRALVRAALLNGLKPRVVTKLGTSDLNILYPVVSANAAAFGPGRSELSHTDREEVSIEELALASRIYRDFILQFASILDPERKKS